MIKYGVLLLLLVGCSGNVTGDGAPTPAVEAPLVGSGHGTCQTRKGTYVASYAPRSGTCGPNPDRLLQVDQTVAPASDAGAATGCTGPGESQSADNCEVDYDNKCPQPTGSAEVSGHSKWNAEGTYGTAVEQWTVFGAAGNVMCMSIYDVTVTKQ